MYWPLVVMGLGTALLAALIGWGMTARYGWQRALAVPVLALVALAIALWRARFLDLTDGIEAEAAGLAIAAPVLSGAFLGIILAARRRK